MIQRLPFLILFLMLSQTASGDARLAIGYNLPVGLSIELGRVAEERDYWYAAYSHSDLLFDVSQVELGWMTPIGDNQNQMMGIGFGQIKIEDEDEFLGIFEVEGVREDMFLLKFAHYYSGLSADSGRFGLNWVFGPEGSGLSFDFSYRFDL